MSRRAAIYLLVVLAAAVAGAVPAHASAFGRDGPRVTETRRVTGFTRVRLAFPVDATFTEGAGRGCTLSVEPALAGRLRTEVRDGTLFLEGPEDGRDLDLHHGARLDCTVPRLDAVTIDTAARVTIHGGVRVHPVTLTVHGAGEVRYTGDASVLEVELDGAAAVVLAGRAARLEVALNGTGGVDAEDLVAHDARVSVDGAGAAKVTLGGGRAKLRVNGIGRIEWGGTASAVDARAGLLGSIRRRG